MWKIFVMGEHNSETFSTSKSASDQSPILQERRLKEKKL